MPKKEKQREREKGEERKKGSKILTRNVRHKNRAALHSKWGKKGQRTHMSTHTHTTTQKKKAGQNHGSAQKNPIHFPEVLLTSLK